MTKQFRLYTQGSAAVQT